MVKDGNCSEGQEQSLRISAQSFGALALFITSELGIQMPPAKAPMVQSRLLRRVRALGLQSIDEYCDHLFSSAGAKEERVHFIDAITTNKTDFFREPQHFTFLTRTALPQLARQRRAVLDRKISVWSAACSSGEEPYTLAMILNEYASAHPGFDFQILATDVSTKVLQMAKDGIYSREQIEPVPPELRRKYLLMGKGGKHSLARVVPSLRERIGFHALNFMDDDYCVREMFDVIFCRNVLIYFNRPTREAVIQKICRNLKAGGYLFVSHSESLSGLELPLDSLGSSCFRKLGAHA